MNQTNDIHFRLSNSDKPSFVITVDTEGDNQWSRSSRTITTRNAAFLHRFQLLCESHGLKPTYLTNYEMANSPIFQELGRDILQRGAGEIGMHLHAWNTPPLVSLTNDDFFHHPYLIEYPEDVMREKITILTDLLEDTFGVKMVSHRAGRWSFNEIYARILLERGYRVDCSVTPLVTFKNYLGDPSQNGGTNFYHFPEEAYFIDLNDISAPGDSTLLEVPMTINSEKRHLKKLVAKTLRSSSLVPRALNRLFPTYWFRPNGKNINDMLRIMERAIRERKSYVQFMLHSSELMPGGSPAFPHEKDIENLYDHLEQVFFVARETFKSATLIDYFHNALAREC